MAIVTQESFEDNLDWGTAFFERFSSYRLGTLSNGGQPVRCEFHNDAKASAVYFHATGYYYCSTCGRGWWPDQFLEELGYSKEEAAKEVEYYRLERDEDDRSHVRLLPFDPHHKTRPNKVQMEKMKAAIERAREELSSAVPIVKKYMQDRGLEYNTLWEAGVGYIPGDPLKGEVDRLLFPYYVNGELYGIRTRNNLGGKGAIKSSAMVPYGIDTLGDSKQCYIVEGESDCLRLRQATALCSGYNIPVIGIPGAYFKQEWARYFEDVEEVYIVPQDDETSSALVKKIQEKLGPERCQIRPIKFDRRDDPFTKDICDFLSAPHHTEDELIDMLDVMPLQIQREIFYEYNDRMTRDRPHREWLWEGIIMKGSKTAVNAPPKAGKTFFFLNLIKNVLVGAPFAGKATQKCSVFIVEEEHEEGDWLDRLEGILGAKLPEGAAELHIYHRAGVSIAPVNPAWEACLKEMRRLQPGLCILDPFRNLVEGDENDSETFVKAYKEIDKMRRLLPDMSTIIIDHEGKGSSQNLVYSGRGSSHKGAAPDQIIQVERYKKDSKEYVTLNFVGRAGSPDPITFEFESGHYIISDQIHVVELSETEIRQQKLFELLTASNKPRTQAALAAVLGVSADTLKSDISTLEKKKGCVIKSEGGTGQKPKTYLLDPDSLQLDFRNVKDVHAVA